MNPCFIKSNVEYNEDHVTLHFTVLDRQYQVDITDAIDRTNGFINWSKVVTILTQHNFNPDVATKLSVTFSLQNKTHRDTPCGTVMHKQHPFARFADCNNINYR